MLLVLLYLVASTNEQKSARAQDQISLSNERLTDHKTKKKTLKNYRRFCPEYMRASGSCYIKANRMVLGFLFLCIFVKYHVCRM